jgi:hypothetical protein
MDPQWDSAGSGLPESAQARCPSELKRYSLRLGPDRQNDAGTIQVSQRRNVVQTQVLTARLNIVALEEHIRIRARATKVDIPGEIQVTLYPRGSWLTATLRQERFYAGIKRSV